MTVSPVLDFVGRRRSPATTPGYAGRSPRNMGRRYPADPPAVQEIIAVMREAGTDRHGARLRALIVVLWRGGLRIQEEGRTPRQAQERTAYALRQRCTVYDAVVKDTRCEADASSNAGGLLANVAD